LEVCKINISVIPPRRSGVTPRQTVTLQWLIERIAQQTALDPHDIRMVLNALKGVQNG
jgi:hypothetical protein